MSQFLFFRTDKEKCLAILHSFSLNKLFIIRQTSRKTKFFKVFS